MDNCSLPWAVFYLWLYVAKASALHCRPLLLLLCCLLLCTWFWSFSFQKNIQNEWAEEGEKRESQSNRKRLWVSVDTASPPEAGGAGLKPRLHFPSPLLLSHGLSPQMKQLANAQVHLTPTYWKFLPGSGLRLSVSLSLWGQAFPSFLSLLCSF